MGGRPGYIFEILIFKKYKKEKTASIWAYGIYMGGVASPDTRTGTLEQVIWACNPAAHATTAVHEHLGLFSSSL